MRNIKRTRDAVTVRCALFELVRCGTLSPLDFLPSLMQHRTADTALRFLRRGEFPVFSHLSGHKQVNSKLTLRCSHDGLTFRGTKPALDFSPSLTQYSFLLAASLSLRCNSRRQSVDCLGLDSTFVKSPTRWHRRAQNNGPQAIGKSRGGWNTKVHLITAINRFALTFSVVGNAHDALEGRAMQKNGFAPPQGAAMIMDRANEGGETR